MIITVTARRKAEVTVEVKVPDGSSTDFINAGVNAALDAADWQYDQTTVSSNTTSDDGAFISYFGEIR